MMEYDKPPTAHYLNPDTSPRITYDGGPEFTCWKCGRFGHGVPANSEPGCGHMCPDCGQTKASSDLRERLKSSSA